MRPGSERRRTALFAAGVLLLTLLAYLPALRGGFVWDDDHYVTGNSVLRSWEGLFSIWFNPISQPYPVGSQYYPLVYTTFLVEYQLWGLHPFGYHLVNVLLHAGSAVLLGMLMRRLGIAGGWVGALLFAVHPVAVESVAWVTERKNVLSLFFYLLSFLTYVSWSGLDREAETDGRRGRLSYVLALLFFFFALVSKSVTCTLPAAVLVVLWWKRGRIRKADVVPLVPFFVLGLGLGLLTVWMEKHRVGAQGDAWELGLVERMLVAGRVVWFYLGKLLWPHPVAFFYRRWDVSAADWVQYLYPAALLGTFALFWLKREKLGRGPFAALAAYTGTLLPALGFFNVYPMRYSFVADHFQYHASIYMLGFVAAVAASTMPRILRAPLARYGLLGGVLLAYSVLTFQHAQAFQSARTLWEETIERTPTAWAAFNNLGMEYQRQGNAERSRELYEKAVELNPRYPEALVNLGSVLETRGQDGQARIRYERALEVSPRYAVGHFNLARILARHGESERALRHFREAIRQDPFYDKAHGELALLLSAQGRIAEALYHARRAATLSPGEPGYQSNLAALLARTGRTSEAAAILEQILKMDPGNARARHNLEQLRKTKSDFP